jgi:V8-like Glu-specific endopeptidase
LTWSELRDRAETVEATEEVPENLRSLWSDLSVRREAAVRTIEKGAEARPTRPYRPAWVASALKPQSAPRRTPPRLQHRGVPVDPLVVWGADDRRIYDDTRYPWGCVCLIQGSRLTGSGVLVGPRHVLTASHIVDWGGIAETIEVHRAGGTVAATAKTVRRWTFTKISGQPGAETVDEDYAVLVTDQRLGDRFGSMGVRTYDSAWDDEDYWWTIGYAGDVANGIMPIWQRDKKLDEDEFDYGSGRAMTTAADMMPRQSGSPMFRFWADGPYVVAVASAVGDIFLSGTENWCAGGSDLTSLVSQARSGDP